MEQKSRLVLSAAAVVAVLLLHATIYRSCVPDGGRSNINPIGTERYEAVSGRAQDVARSTEESIGKSLEAIGKARSGVTESLCGVGEVRVGLGRIEGESVRAADDVSRIESGISVIERILQEAANRPDNLAHSGVP